MDLFQDLDEQSSHLWEFDFSGGQNFSASQYSFRIDNTEILNIRQGQFQEIEKE